MLPLKESSIENPEQSSPNYIKQEIGNPYSCFTLTMLSYESN